MQPQITNSPNNASRVSTDTQVEALIALYGDGIDGSSPMHTQWSRLIDGDLNRPVTVINFFKLREVADYASQPDPPDAPRSGGEAMMLYAAVSGPTLEGVGGRFLLTSAFEGSLMGDDEEWDMVAVGSYPSRNALLALFENDDYADAFCHRLAAVERQRVVMVGG